MRGIRALILFLLMASSSAASKDVTNGDILKTTSENKKETVIGSSSDIHPQYAIPPGYSGHYGNGMMPVNPSPAQIPQYLLQANHQPVDNSQNAISDLKSDISQLKETVLLLSSVVKQNVMAQNEKNDQRSDGHENRNAGYQQNNYGNYGPPDDQVSIDVYQSNKGGGYNYNPKPAEKKVIK